MDPRVNACIPITPLEQLINGTDLTPQLVNDTSTTFCAMPFCSPSTVSLIENTMNQNCVESPQDLDDNYLLYGLASLYTPIKQGMCQRVSGPPTNGTFCTTVLTADLLNYSKKHPNKHGWKILENTTETQQYLDSIPNSIVCTPCNQAIMNPLANFVNIHQLTLDPSITAAVRALQSGIQGKCGSSFIQGHNPQPSPTPSHAAASFSFPILIPVLSIAWVALSLSCFH
ncbi:hypothetical protein BGZ46_005672 [Entomortierella lignicola]|nr:hypothetical protein BGZ46_005672 [Entomortierella lignicola]